MSDISNFLKCLLVNCNVETYRFLQLLFSRIFLQLLFSRIHALRLLDNVTQLYQHVLEVFLIFFSSLNIALPMFFLLTGLYVIHLFLQTNQKLEVVQILRRNQLFQKMDQQHILLHKHLHFGNLQQQQRTLGQKVYWVKEVLDMFIKVGWRALDR